MTRRARSSPIASTGWSPGTTPRTPTRSSPCSRRTDDSSTSTAPSGRAAIHRDHLDRFARSPGSWFEVDQVGIDGLVAVATWRRHRAADGSGTHPSWRGVDVIEFGTDGSIVTKSTYAKATGPVYEHVPDA
jgi:hypothetical protein